MTSEFPVTTVVTIVVGLYEISLCNGDTKFKEVPPTDGGLGGIGTAEGHDTVGCDVGDGVREFEVLTNALIHGESYIGWYFD